MPSCNGPSKYITISIKIMIEIKYRRDKENNRCFTRSFSCKLYLWLLYILNNANKYSPNKILTDGCKHEKKKKFNRLFGSDFDLFVIYST